MCLPAQKQTVCSLNVGEVSHQLELQGRVPCSAALGQVAEPCGLDSPDKATHPQQF